MKASELIAKLNEAIEQHGDITVTGSSWYSETFVVNTLVIGQRERWDKTQNEITDTYIILLD